MFLNIITPCSRPHLLHAVAESINIPKENYRWIVVFDSETIPTDIPECEAYCIKDVNSVCGNAQRNLAIDLVTEGWMYFNDDDTTMHPELWDNIKDLDEDFISFKQEDANGNPRLEGNVISIGRIDSHNFIVSRECIGDSKFYISRYDADGLFANECYKKTNNKIYIPKPLSIYNSLK
jgi:hypothetical protein